MEKSEDNSINEKGINKKKLFLIAMFLVLGIGIVFAAWAFSYNNTIQATVLKGVGVLMIVEDISDFDVNATGGNVTNNQNITLFNKNGFKQVTLNLTVNKVLTELSCPNHQNDCSVNLLNRTNNSIIPSGTTFWLAPQWNNFTLETSCVQDSCGQNISIEVDIQ